MSIQVQLEREKDFCGSKGSSYDNKLNNNHALCRFVCHKGTGMRQMKGSGGVGGGELLFSSYGTAQRKVRNEICYT